MSRSYKKTPYCGDRKGKSSKRAANSKVRAVLKQNPDAITSGSAYRKLYDSWEICDYGWLCSWEEYWENELEVYRRMLLHYPEHVVYPNKKESYKKWRKYYKMK